ncbi:hypothetical protein BT96DRAFT_981916 [Gymnopus androsaceus JB14]|uniref:Uncharacterized protein n=1 Tax=Gymnopus androsaceus JB14 TaxID=1447944 RepID=A0A6A4GK41_9AGAR|nr:hypothetical protein BT96DRAFT_981916 [Gymnopus androsaceus JB14]
MCDGTGAEDDPRSVDDADGMGESWVERKTLQPSNQPSQPSSISQTERNENESKTTKVLHILSTSILLRYIGVWHRPPGRIRPMHLYWGFWTQMLRTSFWACSDESVTLAKEERRKGTFWDPWRKSDSTMPPTGGGSKFNESIQVVLECMVFFLVQRESPNWILKGPQSVAAASSISASSTSLPASTKSSNRKAVAAPASLQGRAGTKNGIEDVLAKAFGGDLRGLQNLRSENLRSKNGGEMWDWSRPTSAPTFEQVLSRLLDPLGILYIRLRRSVPLWNGDVHCKGKGSNEIRDHFGASISLEISQPTTPNSPSFFPPPRLRR